MNRPVVLGLGLVLALLVAGLVWSGWRGDEGRAAADVPMRASISGVIAEIAP